MDGPELEGRDGILGRCSHQPLIVVRDRRRDGIIPSRLLELEPDVGLSYRKFTGGEVVCGLI